MVRDTIRKNRVERIGGGFTGGHQLPMLPCPRNNFCATHWAAMCPKCHYGHILKMGVFRHFGSLIICSTQCSTQYSLSLDS